jgi:lipopolysaccharide export system permease protein
VHTLDRYVIRQVLVPTVLGLVLLVLLFTAFTAVQLLRSAALGNLSAGDVLALVIAHDIAALEVLLPSAFFAALIMVTCTWHRDGEPYALYASGVSPDRLSQPLRLLAVVVAVCVALLSVYGRPYSYVLREHISDRATNLSSSQMAPQRFYRWDANFVIQAEDIHRSTPNLSRVFARIEAPAGTVVLKAQRGQIDETDALRRQTLTLIDGSSYQIGAQPLDAEGLPARRAVPDRITRFDRLVYRAQRPESDARSRRRARSTADLASATEPKDIAEFQWRLAMPMIAFLVALMAIELGRLRPKQSPYARFGVAIVVYALVFNLSSITSSAVENGLLPKYPGVFTSVLIMLGAFLVLRRLPSLTLRQPP